MTTFDQWLAALAAAGKRAPDINIDRAVPFSFTFTLSGNWTGAVIESALRAQPDAGSPVASFTTANGGYSAGTNATTFTLTMNGATTNGLPADGTGNGVAVLAWDVLFTPSGGTEMRLFGGKANVLGEVTDA